MQRKTTKILLFLLVAILLLGSGAMGMRLISGTDKTAEKGMILADNAEEWNKELDDKSNGQKGIKIPGYADISAFKDDKTWKVTLLNPEGNPCYFKYSLEIADTGKTIYQSDLIEPGKAIREFTPENVPEAGDYELYLNISTYSLDEEKAPMNGAQVKANLHIE